MSRKATLPASYNRPASDLEAMPADRSPRTDDEIIAAAMTDPDNPPMSRTQLARMKRVPRTKTLRRALGLTQEDFSQRYGIPLGTLRDWEQERTEPDGAARTYLNVIAAAPELVQDIIAKERARRDAALKDLDAPR